MYLRSDRSIVLAIVMMLCMTVTSFAGSDAVDIETGIDDRSNGPGYEAGCDTYEGMHDIEASPDMRQEDTDLDLTGGLSEAACEEDAVGTDIREQGDNESADVSVSEEENADAALSEPEEDTQYEVLEQDGVIYRVIGKGSISVSEDLVRYEPDKGYDLEAIYITEPGDDSEDIELCRDLLIHPSFEEGTVITFCFERSEPDTMRTDESSRAIYDGVWDESSGAVSQGGGND